MDYEFFCVKNEPKDHVRTEMESAGDTFDINRVKMESEQNHEDSNMLEKPEIMSEMEETIPCSSTSITKTETQEPSVDEKQDFICQYCSLTCQTIEAFQKHVDAHEKEKPFECNNCNSRFKLRQSLEIHIGIEHKANKKRFACSVCKKKYCKEKSMLLHQKLHGDPKFQCKICDKKFDLARCLKLHMGNSHGKQNSFPCPDCHEMFGNRRDIATHKEEKHQETVNHNCKECGKLFHLKTDLIKHLRTHAEERPFPCNHCQKCFSTKLTLEAHVNTHLSDKPFICKECQIRFSTTTEFENHILSHQYVCTHCQTVFPKRSLLNDHLNVSHSIQSPEKPFKCNVCSTTFSHKSSLIRHGKNKPHE